MAYREKDGGWYGPKKLAIINASCDGCGGSPICMEACPPPEMARGCIVLLHTPDNPAGIVAVDPDVCTGCGLCAYHGPALLVTAEGRQRPVDGNFRRVAGCPWEAIDIVAVADWTKRNGPLTQGAGAFEVGGVTIDRAEVERRMKAIRR